MQLYVLDRSKNVLATTDGFYNDLHHKELTAGASTYVFDLNKSDEAAQYMVSGNIITMLDDQGRPWSFEILYYDETQTAKTVHCEDVGINLFNKACDVWYYQDAKPFADYFNVITDGTPWELGVNQLADLSRALTFTGRDTGLGRLLSVLKAFDNAECRFHVQMNGPVPVKYVIDVYKQIGTVQDNIQIAYNEELDNIQKTETRQEFVTALAGVGSVIQDTETDADGSTVDTNKPQEYVSFADLEFDNGDFYTKAGDKFLRARTANAQFNPGDQGFIEDFYEYDTDSSTELFNRTTTQLQTRSQPQFKYDAQVKVVDPNLDIGDTVTIIDHDYNPALYLQARVATLDKSYTDATQGAITFTNYVVLTDTVTQQIAALKSKVNGIKNGSSSYVWIRYADDDQGTGISQSPKDKTYVAILAKVNQPVPSDDPKDYAGHWVRIVGKDGLDGQIGPQGKDGAQGIPGKEGVSSYTHIAYANSADGVTDFSVSDSNRTYIGMYVDQTATDSTDPTKYLWTLIKGADGAQGTPGKAGADGKTPYFHIAYANSSDGTTGFSTIDSLNKLYIGQYTDFVQSDSTDPTSYAWTLIKGDKGDTGADGVAGKDGIGIKSTTITYALGDSGTTTPTTGWTTSVPSLVKGKYLWTKTVWLYTDNTSESGYSTTYIGKDGNDGNNGVAGKDGVGISATKVEYVGSTSGTNKPTSGWLTNVPSVAAGSFLWTKTTWNYTDGTSESGYSVAKMGEKGNTGAQGLQGPKGDQGIKGPAGMDGKTSYTHIAYANSATGEGFSEQPTGKTFIGMYVDFDATDSTDVTKYNWSLVKGSDGTDGIPGKAGADGKTPYLHIAYASSVDGKDSFYNGTPNNLYTDTKDFNNLSSAWYIHPNSWTKTTDTYKGLSVVQTDQDWDGLSQYIPVKKGDALIYSVYAKNDSGTGKSRVYWPLNNSTEPAEGTSFNTATASPANNPVTLTDKWQRVTGTTIATSDGYLRPRLERTNNNTNILQVAGIKVEKGSIATPWTPNASEANPKYMGTYTDYTQVDSTDPTAYLWSQIKGDAGANGKDGQDAYLHIAYANSVDGKTDFTTDQNQAHNRDYLGTYSDNTKAQSTDPTKYTWQLTRGAQGLQGQPGSKDVPVVKLSSTAPASPKDGDFWYQTTTDSSGQKITGFSVYSGGKWVPSKIDQSTLVLTKLVSVEIDSATINSPDITVPFDYFDESQNEYKGSMEFKDGMLKHISTMTGGGMLKTVVSPTGYTLDAYANQSEYTKNNPYIHTEMYADNISLSNANTKKSGILDSSGIGGTLNDGTNNSIGINMSWADVQKYLSEMGESGTGRTYDWFDIMSSVRSHPNLLHNSTFSSGKSNWDTGSAGYVSNDVHDGNFVLQMSSAGGSNFCTQTLTNFPWEGNQLCVSFWANILKHDGGVNAGVLITFTGGGTSYTATIQDAGKGLSTGWKFYSFNPIPVPDGTSSIKFAFYNNEHKGNIINFAQPMLNAGSRVAPYMPTY